MTLGKRRLSLLKFTSLEPILSLENERSKLVRKTIYFQWLALLTFWLVACASPQPVSTTQHDLQNCTDVDRRPSSNQICLDLFRGRPSQSEHAEAIARNQSSQLLARRLVQERVQELQVENRELSKDEMAQLWRPLKLEAEFSREHSDAFWGSLLGLERLLAAKDSDLAPIAVAGEQASFNWASAARRLDAIPIGKLEISEILISEVNSEIINATKVQKRFATDASSLPAGKFRARRATSYENFFKPLSEGAFQVLSSNREVSGIKIWELPWSSPNKRRFIYWHPSQADIVQNIRALVQDINQRMVSIREGKSREDAIDLAAEFQWRFQQIQPMVGGNSHTGRALMNRILAEFGLPPSSLRADTQDLTLTLNDQKAYVRKGVIESIKLVATQNLSSRVTPYQRGFGNRITIKEIKELTNQALAQRDLTNAKDLFPDSEQQIHTFAGKKFTLGDDLMLHDQSGIPHIISFDGGSPVIRPIADRTYILYSMGGKMNGVKNLQRDLSDVAMSSVRDSAEFFIALKKDPRLAEKVKVEKYEQIQKSNNAGDFLFYESQIPLLLDVALIKEDPATNPLAVLVQNRGHQTDFNFLGRSYLEKAFLRSEKSTEVGELIGQYMRMDQFYYELREHVAKGREDFLQGTELQAKVLDRIEQSREKLHSAARTILKPLFTEINSKSAQDDAYLMKHPQFRLMYEYLKQTPLFYPTMTEAKRNLDLNTIPVMRSAARSAVRFTGFISDTKVRHMLLGIPFAGPRFAKFVENLHAEIARMKKSESQTVNPDLPYIRRKAAEYAAGNPTIQKAIEALMQYIFAQPYAARAMNPEMARAYVTEYLHTQLDLGPKERLSTTTHPYYVIGKNKEEQYFAKFAWQNAEVFIIDIPRADARIDIASGFIAQNEIGISSQGLVRTKRAIRFKLAADEGNIFYSPTAPITDRATRIMNLMFDLPLEN